MNARRHWPLGVALLAVAGAVALTLIARDAQRWEQSLETGDLRFAISPGPEDLWEPKARLVDGAARQLLGLDDDLEFRRAAQLFRGSRPRAGAQRTQADLAVAARAQSALAEIERSGQEPARRSAAASALGILSLSDALGDSSQAALFFRKSISRFTTAVRLDPGNRDAMANLELALKLSQAAASRVDEAEGLRGGGTSAGAGRGSGGSGF